MTCCLQLNSGNKRIFFPHRLRPSRHETIIWLLIEVIWRVLLPKIVCFEQISLKQTHQGVTLCHVKERVLHRDSVKNIACCSDKVVPTQDK